MHIFNYNSLHFALNKITSTFFKEEFIMTKKYWEKVWRVREYILESLKKEGIKFYTKTEEPPYPQWNRIEDNGAIGLICEVNGLPTSLMTPFGEVNFVRRKLGFITTSQAKQEFMNKLKEKLGLIHIADRNALGNIHQVYSITTLPWSEETLPLLVERQTLEEEIDELYKKSKRMFRQTVQFD